MSDQHNRIQNQQRASKSSDQNKNKIKGTEEDHARFEEKLLNVNALINNYLTPDSTNTEFSEVSESMGATSGKDIAKEKRVTAGLEQQQGIIETPAQRMRNKESADKQRIQGARTTGKTNDAIKSGDQV